MQIISHPWPLSELTPDEAARIVAMPPQAREVRLRKLVADIKSGELARQNRLRAIDERNSAL